MSDVTSPPQALGELTVEFTEDPAAFLAAAGSHLAQDPVLTTVVSTVADRAVAEDRVGRPRPPHPRWWAVVRRRDEVVGAAMRTAPFAPHPMFVLPMPDDGARALARALHARGEFVGGLNGALPAAQVLADELARLGDAEVSIHEHTRLFELGDLVEPHRVPGRLRLAEAADLEVAVCWFSAFHVDAEEQAGRLRQPGGEPLGQIAEEDVLDRIEDGRVWLWEVDGVPVHLTGATLPAFGVSRIGPVYTPREQRGRGFASAGVAAVSRRFLAQGVRVCLFTDQANPTSNRIYRALGYEPVVDMANLLVTTPAPA